MCIPMQYLLEIVIEDVNSHSITFSLPPAHTHANTYTHAYKHTHSHTSTHTLTHADSLRRASWRWREPLCPAWIWSATPWPQVKNTWTFSAFFTPSLLYSLPYYLTITLAPLTLPPSLSMTPSLLLPPYLSISIISLHTYLMFSFSLFLSQPLSSYLIH